MRRYLRWRGLVAAREEYARACLEFRTNQGNNTPDLAEQEGPPEDPTEAYNKAKTELNEIMSELPEHLL